MAKAHPNQKYQKRCQWLRKRASHFFRFFLFLIFIVVILILLVLFVIGCLLSIVVFLLLGLLDLTQCFPFLRKSISLNLVIGDNDVVENCTSFNLPQIKAKESKV